MSEVEGCLASFPLEIKACGGSDVHDLTQVGVSAPAVGVKICAEDSNQTQCGGVGGSHRTGFRRNPQTTFRHPLPPCNVRDGVLGIDPTNFTRGSISAKNKEGEGDWSGDGTQTKINPSLRRLGLITNIARFVRHFHNSKVCNPHTRSYTEVVQTPLDPSMD